MDNRLTEEDFANPALARNKIAKANEGMMLKCCKEAKVGVILANMTPWHGPSMDVGTAFECGFMSALASLYPNVIIIGYTDSLTPFAERVTQYRNNHNTLVSTVNGRKVDLKGRTIEDLGDAIDNLMLTHAIEKTGGKIVSSFDGAVELARNLADQRLKTTH